MANSDLMNSSEGGQGNDRTGAGVMSTIYILNCALLLLSVYDFERNLVKLTRSLPPSLIADLDILKKHKGLLHYNTNIKKALLLPPVINQQQ